MLKKSKKMMLITCLLSLALAIPLLYNISCSTQYVPVPTYVATGGEGDVFDECVADGECTVDETCLTPADVATMGVELSVPILDGICLPCFAIESVCARAGNCCDGICEDVDGIDICCIPRGEPCTQHSDCCGNDICSEGNICIIQP